MFVARCFRCRINPVYVQCSFCRRGFCNFCIRTCSYCGALACYDCIMKRRLARCPFCNFGAFI